MQANVRPSIRKNDNVIVTAGRDRGKRGRVLRVLPAKNRLIVEAAVVTGRPASRPARRPRFPPPWATLPSVTSSTSAGSMPDFFTACSMAWAAMVMAGVWLNPPRPALAMPVRA